MVRTDLRGHPCLAIVPALCGRSEQTTFFLGPFSRSYRHVEANKVRLEFPPPIRASPAMEAAARASAFLSLRSPHPPPPLSRRSLPSLPLPGRPISDQRRGLCLPVRSEAVSASAPSKGSESFVRTVLSNMERVYLSRNPTAKAILDLVRSCDGNHICYDHFAFRTYGIDGYGIDSMAKYFLDFGYTQREELRFPAKKLKAYWFAPPSYDDTDSRYGINGPLPRIFISELLVDEMSSQSQEIIGKYIRTSGCGNKHAALASSLGCLTWEKPLYSDYQQLSRESEYAAWTLVNGYVLNHVTISTHRLKSHIRNIESLNRFIEDQGFKLNSEGGILKVSPDGLLLQSSTVADSITFNFYDGVAESVPCSYIEFAERLVLPQYKNLTDEEIKEFHRRDGFEVGNADKIFESTSKGQVTRKAS